jgi:predicted phage terminase large subunit-like protein
VTSLKTRDEMAGVARRSPGAFASLVMGYEQGNLHGQMQQFLSDNDNCYIEFPRGHGKTGQMILRVAWQIGKDPSARIKYVQQSDAEAKKTTGLIKQVIESEDYRRVFPEVVPDPECWGKSEFKVKSDRWQRDATVEAKSIFGRAGGRADILIADDICDLRNAIQQTALREQVKEFWATNWLPMRDMTRDRHPRTWKVGTCYHADDITADWRRQHSEHGGLLRLPVINFESPWPERISEEYLREIRTEVGPFAFARAYELEPVTSELLVFDTRWLRDSLYDTIPEWESKNGMMVAAIDFAFTEKKLDGDPDWSVCLIGWKDGKGGLWLRDILRQRSTFPDFARAATERMRAAGVQQAVAEANGPQKGLVQQMQRDCPVPLKPLNRDRDKITRASERQGFVEAGKFHLPRDPSLGDLSVRTDFRPLWDEMATFPVGGHDDTVDAAIDLIELATDMGAPLPVNRIESPEKELRHIYGKAPRDRPGSWGA